MKILHTVEKYFPPDGGMQKVVREISEYLAHKGNNVTIATGYDPRIQSDSGNNVKVEQFRISGNAIRGYEGKPEEITRYQHFIRNTNFDVITNFAAQQWATDLALPILKQIHAKKVFVPTGFSGLYLPQYKEYFAEMKTWMKQYDMNVFLSNDYRDINFARKNGVKKKVLIPNGASEEEFLSTEYVNIRKKLKIPINNFLILLVGSHTGAKGHKEAIAIFKKTHIINATLLIVAHPSWTRCARRCFLEKLIFNASFQRLTDRKQLIITSLSRQETVSAYKQADLFLFPSNIECSPIVLFEAMASQTPFLTTDVGNAREIIKWLGSGIMLPTSKDKYGYSLAEINTSAASLEAMYHNPKKRKIMAENGYRAWKKRFTWDKIAKQYEKVYHEIIV